MKVLNHTQNLAVIRLKDGRILRVTEDGISLTFVKGKGHKTKKFGFDDMLLINDTMCKVMSEVIEERNYLRQHSYNYIEVIDY